METKINVVIAHNFSQEQILGVGLFDVSSQLQHSMDETPRADFPVQMKIRVPWPILPLRINPTVWRLSQNFAPLEIAGVFLFLKN